MFEQILQDIVTCGWSQIPAFLSLDELKAIEPLFNELEFLPARIGKGEILIRDPDIRGDYISWIDPLLPPSPLKKPLGFLGQLQNELNRHFFLGLKEFECHLAKYPEKSFYKKHLDRFEKESTRSFTFVFYLNPDWKKEDGGELVIYTKEGEKIAVVEPRPGTFVGFLSGDFPHEVQMCLRERRSLTGWMHTKMLS